MSVLRAILGLALIAVSIFFMATNPETMWVWILGGAGIAAGGVLLVSAFKRKKTDTL